MPLTHIAAHNLPSAVCLGEAPTLAPSAVVRDCHFGRYTQVGEQVQMQDCVLGDYSYLQPHCDLISTYIGKFSNIAAMVRINPGFHPMECPTLHHFTYRPVMYGMAEQSRAEQSRAKRRRLLRLAAQAACQHWQWRHCGRRGRQADPLPISPRHCPGAESYGLVGLGPRHVDRAFAGVQGPAEVSGPVRSLSEILPKRPLAREKNSDNAIKYVAKFCIAPQGSAMRISSS